MKQLEKAERNLHSLRQQYEEKMMVLQHQIRTIETDRDKAIKEMGKEDRESGRGKGDRRNCGLFRV